MLGDSRTSPGDVFAIRLHFTFHLLVHSGMRVERHVCVLSTGHPRAYGPAGDPVMEFRRLPLTNEWCICLINFMARCAEIGWRSQTVVAVVMHPVVLNVAWGCDR